MKLIIKTTSERIWWGIHGLVGKNGWEDIDVYDENGKLIDRLHLYAKDYLRAGLRFLKDDAVQLDYAISVRKYLVDNQYYFWYYYDDKADEDKFEVAYFAPKNKEGVKPKSIEIWTPEETIDAATLINCVNEFATRFLQVENYSVEIKSEKSLEESVKSFLKNQKEIQNEKVSLKAEQILELSRIWKVSEESVWNRLKGSCEE